MKHNQISRSRKLFIVAVLFALALAVILSGTVHADKPDPKPTKATAPDPGQTKGDINSKSAGKVNNNRPAVKCDQGNTDCPETPVPQTVSQPGAKPTSPATKVPANLTDTNGRPERIIPETRFECRAWVASYAVPDWENDVFVSECN